MVHLDFQNEIKLYYEDRFNIKKNISLKNSSKYMLKEYLKMRFPQNQNIHSMEYIINNGILCLREYKISKDTD